MADKKLKDNINQIYNWCCSKEQKNNRGSWFNKTLQNS